MAKAVGTSLRAVQRIWGAHRLQPHRLRTFKRSTDPSLLCCFALKQNIVSFFPGYCNLDLLSSSQQGSVRDTTRNTVQRHHPLISA